MDWHKGCAASVDTKRLLRSQKGSSTLLQGTNKTIMGDIWYFHLPNWWLCSLWHCRILSGALWLEMVSGCSGHPSDLKAYKMEITKDLFLTFIRPSVPITVVPTMWDLGFFFRKFIVLYQWQTVWVKPEDSVKKLNENKIKEPYWKWSLLSK